MNLKFSFLLALLLSAISLTGWEFYWRSNGVPANLDDDRDLWVSERDKIKSHNDNDVIFVGSSRTLFDIQKDVWKKTTGTRAIMLAKQGASPLPVFRDIVNNTDFRGIIVVGVTPGLFFSTTHPGAFPWDRAQNKVDYYYKRTYAQELGFLLSITLQSNLAMISASEEQWSDDIDLKALLSRIHVGNRTGQPPLPDFFNFESARLDRNIRMTERTARDTAFANTIKKVWLFFGKGAPPPQITETINYFTEDVKKFQSKGGHVILVRYPSSGGLKMGEDHGIPRASSWEELMKIPGVVGYHFEDYPEFQNLEIPEWSHLSAPAADYFTETLAKIMIRDGALNNVKTN